jgi:4a-hydroxytetrahydrobiopterin dehydratase
MENLKGLNCEHLTKESQSASDDQVKILKKQIPEWNLVDVNGVKHLEREFKFKDFKKALAFTNQVGRIAEEQDHHPTLKTEWGNVTVTWWTHIVNGLHINDFIMAAKTDELYEP